MEDTSSFDKILGWGLFLGVIFLVWQSYKKQQEIQQADQQNLQESGESANVISYKALLAQWQPLEYENISDLKRELRIAVQKTGGDLKIETAAPSISTISPVSVEPPTYNYGNHERWKVVRGLDRRIIGYELQRDANIKQS